MSAAEHFRCLQRHLARGGHATVAGFLASQSQCSRREQQILHPRPEGAAATRGHWRRDLLTEFHARDDERGNLVHVFHLPYDRVHHTLALRAGLVRQASGVLNQRPQIPFHTTTVQIRELLTDRRITHDDPASVLHVGARWRLIRRIDQLDQQLFRNLPGIQSPHRAAVVHHVENTHRLGHSDFLQPAFL